MANDFAAAIVAIETTLGANCQGSFGSVAARLNEFLGGSSGSVGIYTFTQARRVTVPGSLHNAGQSALIYKLYDADIPAHVMAAGSYTLTAAAQTYDVDLEFIIPISGALALGTLSPLFVQAFTQVTTLTIPGAVHHLGTADLLFQVYDNSDPAAAIQVGSLTVHPTTFDVVITFIVPISGFVVLSAGGPTYAVNFTNTQFVSIPGTTHQFGTRGLLFQVYDNGTPRAAMGDPPTTVHPNTFDVLMDFGVPLSGRVVLMPATVLTGRDFDIRDAGIVNQTAVRVASQNGTLRLQAGANNVIYLLDKTGTSGLTMDLASNPLWTLLSTDRNVQLQGRDFQLRDGGIPGRSACGVGTAAGNLFLQSGGGNTIYFADQLATFCMVLNTLTGALGLGTLTPTHQLELSTGDAVKLGGGPWLAPSDGALKEDVTPFTDGLDVLRALDPVQFRYNGLGGLPRTDEVFIGLITETLRTCAPYLLKPYRGRLRPEAPETDLLALDGGPLVYLLINAVKELASLVTRLQQDLADLRATVASSAADAHGPQEAPAS